MGAGDLIPGSGKFQEPGTGFAKWNELKATAYERTITSQHNFIRFMQSLHVPNDDVHFPPEGGWPQITKEPFAALGKSDKVIEVLRNMAYIKGDVEILNGTPLFDWTERYYLDQITGGDGEFTILVTEPPNEPAPRDVIGLTGGGSGCAAILLDCQNGIVRWIGCGDGRTSFGAQTQGDPAGESDEDWGGETAWPVEEFFEYIKAKFVNLQQLSFNRSRVIEKDLISREPVYDFDFFKEMFQKHGWPGSDYNKDACMAEMTEYCKRHLIH